MARKKFFAAVCGVKNSGKTTLLEGIIRTLTARGLRAAVIKHDGHDFECDVPGTDSRRFVEAGAVGAAVFSDYQYFIRKKRPIPPQKDSGGKEDRSALLTMLADSFSDADVLLIEGCKDYPFRKIEVVRSANSQRPVSNPEGRFLIVSDLPQEELGEKTLPFCELEKITDAILEECSPDFCGSRFFEKKLGRGKAGDALPAADVSFMAADSVLREGNSEYAADVTLLAADSVSRERDYESATDVTLLAAYSALREGNSEPAADCCAVLLRGGRSRRMGRDKAMLSWEGRTFLEAIAGQMEMFPEKYLSCSSEEAGKREREPEGLSGDWTVLPDRIPDCGPLGGIWTALTTCRAEWMMAASCDIPKVRQSLFVKLLNHRSEDVDIVCPVTPDGRMHFTCALYHRTAGTILGEQIRRKDFRMRSLFTVCRVKTIPLTKPEESEQLLNINTEEELKKARSEALA